MQREVLKIRDKGIERLLAAMPYKAGDDMPDLRRWTEIWTRDASRFQISKAKQNALRVAVAMPDRTITIKQERGFVRLSVDPAPVGGFGLPSTYSSIVLAQYAAERLQREHGWSIKGGSHAN